MASKPYMRIIESPDGERKLKVSRKFLESLVREVMEEEGEDDKEALSAAENPKDKAGLASAEDMPKKDTAKEEVPDTEDPADDNIEADQDSPSEDDAGGKLADELVGKTIQSMTMEPKSKILPGSVEVVITFNEITDPFRMLISKTGKVSFFFRNSLHNLL